MLLMRSSALTLLLKIPKLETPTNTTVLFASVTLRRFSPVTVATITFATNVFKILKFRKTKIRISVQLVLMGVCTTMMAKYWKTENTF